MREGAKERLVKIVSVDELELNCLEMIDLVEETGISYVITKDGVPIARMGPVAEELGAAGEVD